MKRLLLFETALQLKKLLRRFDACNPENTWAALSPEADYAGECAGLTYQQIEDYGSIIVRLQIFQFVYYT